MLITMIIIAAGIAFLGWGVHKKQWYFLISGYNTMSKEEQARVNVKGLAKSVAIMTYMTAILLIALGLCIQFELEVLIWVVIVLIIILPIGFLIYSSKFSTDGMPISGTSSNPKAKKISSIITVVTLVVVAVIIYFSVEPTTFDVEDEYFEISGTYGDKMNWSDITEIQLLDELPAISARTNGSAVGSKLKGNFKFKSGDKAKLFLDKKVESYISFKWRGQLYIINEPSVEETKSLYEKMLNNK